MVFSDIVSGLVAWLIGMIQAYGPWSVFLGVIIEEIIIPIPSPLVIMGAGALLIPAELSLFDVFSKITYLIVLPGSVATVIGSFFAYGIGYYGGRPVINKFKKFIDVSWTDVEKLETKLENKRGWFTIILLRAVPIFPTSPVSLVAGVLRYPIKKYASATLIGAVPRLYILSFLGWVFSSTYISIATSLDAFENVVLGIAAIIIIVALYRHVKKFRDKRLS